MYYTESDSIYEGDIFEPDGYGLIDTIQTNSGVKYLMEGNVRGCSYCFTNHVSLIQFKKDTVNLDFYYRFDSRDWDDYIEVDSTKRVMKAYYHLNDLQESCSCNNEDEGTIEFEIEKNISCSCRFKFNGETFELVEKKEKVILEK
jgi:phenylpropionate dioxygenase-like ring-hydroxylating dioxygenase large terminal subunit